jgi:hypothetical protein
MHIGEFGIFLTSISPKVLMTKILHLRFSPCLSILTYPFSYVENVPPNLTVTYAPHRD